jgi:NAD+ kinase
MKVAIYGRRRQEEYSAQINLLLMFLSEMCDVVEIHEKLYNHLFGELGLEPAAEVARVFESTEVDADLIVSIGGDGTFLRTIAWAGASTAPVLGINTGHLGYLSALSIDRAVEMVREAMKLSDKQKIIERLKSSFVVDRRSLLEVVSPDIRGRRYALNEVTVAKDDSSSVIDADTKINGRPLAEYRADGLIIATPTGSTAYNLSVGGPIVQPSANVWVISPIAAHSLGLRPLVVADDSEIEITVTGRSRTFRLSLDGYSVVLPMGTRVVLRRAPFAVNVVECRGDEFPAMLHQKLFF